METTETTALVASRVSTEDYARLVALAQKLCLLRRNRPNISAAARVAITKGLDAFAADEKKEGEDNDG